MAQAMAQAMPQPIPSGRQARGRVRVPRLQPTNVRPAPMPLDVGCPAPG